MEEFKRYTEELEKSLTKIGIHLNGGSFSVLGESLEDIDEDNLIEHLRNGDVTLVYRGIAEVGELAWTDRVLNPEMFETDTAFKEIVIDEPNTERNRMLKDLGELFEDDE